LLVALERNWRAPGVGRGPLRALGLGFATGLVYFVGTVYWTSSVMRQFGDIAMPVAAVLMVLLAAYLALYPAIFALIVHRLGLRFGLSALWLAPAAWATTELGRGYLFTGFPWVLLGYSQVTTLPVAQVASVTGVYGLSFLVVLVSVALVMVALAKGPARWQGPAAAALVLLAVIGWGSYRLGANELLRQGTPLTVALLQGNVAQEQKWDPALAPEITQRYIRMTREAATRGARLVIWPESSLPYYFEQSQEVGDTLRQLAFATRTYILFGGDQVEPGSPPRYFNSAFLMTPFGVVGGIYRKVHLVPFGEYVPLKNLLFFAGPLVEGVGGFSPGEQVVPLPVDGHPVTTAICYEVVYPNLARDAVRLGSELLTTITNDAWYGRSSAPWQHFAQASMRAIEQGRYLARSANTGVSGIVDPYGRVVTRSQLFETVALVGDVRLLTGRTVYGQIGDAFVSACAVLTLAALLLARRR
jgi:apolipoprotein N-acyltransferase